MLTHLYKYWQIQLYLKANNNAVYFRTNMQVSYRYISQAEWPLYALNPSLQCNPIHNWILQYQSMLSTTQHTLAFYQNILADSQLLAAGYHLLKNFLLASQHNRTQTLLALTHPQVPVLMLVLNVYPNEVFLSAEISSEEKAETRKFLANLLTSELLKSDPAFSPKTVSLLFSFLHKIHTVEGFSDWVALYEQALERLVENQSPRFSFFLLNLLKEADDRVGEFSRHVVGLIVGSQWVPVPEQQLQILYYCFKSLAILNDTDPETIENYVSQHIEPTITYLSQNMRSSVKAMKFALKILTILLGDYQVPCSKELLNGVQATGEALIVQYINYLNQGGGSSIADIELQQGQNESDPIQVALYQLLQLFLTLFGNEEKINIELATYLCIVSTFLGQEQYCRYVAYSDQYIMEVEDEGDINVRNKAIGFLQEMIENKQSKKLLSQYVQQVLGNPNNFIPKVTGLLTSFHLPQTLLSSQHFYVQSALLILYSFTEELIQNQKQLLVLLGTAAQNSPPNSIEAVLSLTILNKLVKKQSSSYKAQYLSFLRAISRKFSDNVGVLLALMRGFYSLSPQNELIISQEGNAVPLLLVRNLLSYLSSNDSAQLQSGYLILQFLLHLLKHAQNRGILQQLMPSQIQLYLLKIYINDGITSQLIIDLLAALAHPSTLQTVYGEIAAGHAHDQNLPALIAKCISNKAIVLSEQQLIQLCAVYGKRLELIGDIIVAYLELAAPQNQELVTVLNNNSGRWLPYLIRYDLLFNLKDSLLTCVRNIVQNTTSPSQLQNQLILPYSLILRNAQQTIQLLSQQCLFFPFLNKLYDYAKLFKGPHLKIATVNVLAAVAAVHPEWARRTLELWDGYGTIDSNEWEDEEEDEDRIINKYFQRMVNEQAEKTLKLVLGELAWDSNQASGRVNQLRQLI